MLCLFHGRIQRGGQGLRTPPPEKSQKYRVSNQYWSRIYENDKATKPEFNVGSSSARQRNVIYDDGRLIVLFGSSHKKNVAKLDPLWQNFLDPRMSSNTLIDKMLVHTCHNGRVILQYVPFGPRRDKTCLRGSRQNDIQTSLLSYRD